MLQRDKQTELLLEAGCYVLLIALAGVVGLGVVIFIHSETRSMPIDAFFAAIAKLNPLVSLFLYLPVVVGVPLAAGWYAWRQSRGWQARHQRAYEKLLARLGLPSDESSRQQAREQVNALIPCEGRQLADPFASIPAASWLWLCFLEDRLLLVSDTGAPIEVEYVRINTLYLVDKTTVGRCGIGLRIGEQTSFFTVRYAEEVMYITSLLGQTSAETRYHASL